MKRMDSKVSTAGILFAAIALLMLCPLSTACQTKVTDYPDEIGGGRDTNPIIPCGTSSDWDQHIREIGNVLYEPGDTGYEYKTFYSGYKFNIIAAIREIIGSLSQGQIPTTLNGYDGSRVYIGYAYSSDSKSWSKYAKIIERGLEDPYVLKVGDTYYLYAEDKESGQSSIRRYHSSDCENWTDDGGTLEKSSSGWDSYIVASPVVWKEGNAWYMLYEGIEHSGNDEDGKVGLATSFDGINWTKESSNPIFDGSGVGRKFDKLQVVCDDIVKIGSTYYMTYHGNEYYGYGASKPFRSGIAHSTSLISWTHDDAPISNSPTVMFYFDDSEHIAHYYYNDSSDICRGYLSEQDLGIVRSKVMQSTQKHFYLDQTSLYGSESLV